MEKNEKNEIFLIESKKYLAFLEEINFWSTFDEFCDYDPVWDHILYGIQWQVNIILNTTIIPLMKEVRSYSRS